MTEKKIKALILSNSIIFRNKLTDALSQEENIITSSLDCSDFSKHNGLENSISADIVIIDMKITDTHKMAAMQIINEINNRTVYHNRICTIAIAKAGSDIKEELTKSISDVLFVDTEISDEQEIYFLREQILKTVNAFITVRSISHRHSTLRRHKKQKKNEIKAIAIGVSTGGPSALHELIPSLCSKTKLPIFIVQHMPPLFTQSLAEKLDRKTASKVIEAKDGKVEKGHVYIAPGGKHMIVRKQDNEIQIKINDTQPWNSCKPSVDMLFHSIAESYGENAIAVILTGMGKDGTSGLEELKKNGAYVIAQDEKTSAVWGMPGSAVKSGHVDEVLPLQDIPHRIGHIINTFSMTNTTEDNIQCRI